MDVINLKFDNWYSLGLTINWLAVALIAAGIYGLCQLIKYLKGKKKFKNLKLKTVELSIGDQKFQFELDHQLQTIAYKIWVELSTRKIGLQFEEDKDVIVEVYNSWYAAFSIIRELMEEIPLDEVDRAEPLINATLMVLNNELRPHLTEWQAKFRKWYSEELEEDKEAEVHKKPQEIQKRYPDYDALIKSLKKTNTEMISYCDQLKKIAFNG